MGAGAQGARRSGAAAVKQGLKLLFAAVGFTWIGTHAIRYFFVVLLAATVWPLTFRWFARLGRKQA